MNLENDTTLKIEQEIDAALKMLGETTAPAEMTSRIQRSLETAAAEAHRARSGRLFWIPATGCAIAAILFVVFTQAYGTRGKQTSSVETAKMAANMPATNGITAARPTFAPAVSSERRKTSSQPVVVRRSRREHPHYRRVANLLSYPLTRQEKLLVRFVQTAKPADLRDLSLEDQVSMVAVQDAEFVAYLKLGSSPSYNEATENTQE